MSGDASFDLARFDLARFDLARFDLALFDLDGTLTDSAPGIINCLRYALDYLEIPHPDLATMRSQLGPPLEQTFRLDYGLDAATAARAIAKYRERYHDVGLFENSVYEGIPDVLAELADGGVTLAVATSKPTPSATRILEHFDLHRHLAFIGGAELAGPRQLKEDVIAHTLENLDSAGRITSRTRAVMIGDRRHDVAGARVHNIPAIGVLWGYGDEEELVQAGAVDIVSSPLDLLPLLRH